VYIIFFYFSLERERERLSNELERTEVVLREEREVWKRESERLEVKGSGMIERLKLYEVENERILQERNGDELNILNVTKELERMERNEEERKKIEIIRMEEDLRERSKMEHELELCREREMEEKEKYEILFQNLKSENIMLTKSSEEEKINSVRMNNEEEREMFILREELENQEREMVVIREEVEEERRRKGDAERMWRAQCESEREEYKSELKRCDSETEVSFKKFIKIYDLNLFFFFNFPNINIFYTSFVLNFYVFRCYDKELLRKMDS